MSIIATTRWESAGVRKKADAGEIWRRFPKFVLGFLIASAIITAIASTMSFADYRKILTPEVVAPIKNLRTWAFIFCFFSIGLTTRIREFASSGARPFWAFTIGVAVNVVLGYILSAVVFVQHWTDLGR